jgi:hypothetical protein
MRSFTFILFVLGGCITQVLTTENHDTSLATAVNVRSGSHQRNVADFWKAPRTVPLRCWFRSTVAVGPVGSLEIRTAAGKVPGFLERFRWSFHARSAASPAHRRFA